MDQAAVHEITPKDYPKKPNWSLRISKFLLLTSFFTCSLTCIAPIAGYQLPYAIMQLQNMLVFVLGFLIFSPIVIPIYLYALYRCARSTRGKTRWWVIRAFVLTPFLIFGALLATQFNFLQTVNMGSKNYHLAQYGSQLPLGPGWWHYRYGVYECDLLNILCHRLYETDDTWMGGETADLVPDDNAKTISLVIFDKVVYTHLVE
jgi:hypothetical protein